MTASLELPPEVREFLDRAAEFNSGPLGIHVLDPAESARQTALLREMEVADRMGLIQLDDANDSNPYCYITSGPAAGMVIHFSHDPEPVIKFPSLDFFAGFLIALKAQDTALWDTEKSAPEHPDQMALGLALRELAGSDDEHAQFLICTYLPTLRADPAAVLGTLAAHPDFFVRESTAEVLGVARIADSRGLLETLAGDRHGQVKSAAQRSLDRWKA